MHTQARHGLTAAATTTDEHNAVLGTQLDALKSLAFCLRWPPVALYFIWKGYGRNRAYKAGKVPEQLRLISELAGFIREALTQAIQHGFDASAQIELIDQLAGELMDIKPQDPEIFLRGSRKQQLLKLVMHRGKALEEIDGAIAKLHQVRLSYAALAIFCRRRAEADQ